MTGDLAVDLQGGRCFGRSHVLGANADPNQRAGMRRRIGKTPNNFTNGGGFGRS